MGTDLIQEICAIRLQQKDSPHLLPPNQIESWVTKAETRLNQLRSAPSHPESEEYIEADCIINNLDEIREIRAELIRDLAYDGAGDISLMTAVESDIYRDLADLFGSLRGIS
ncbi:MAG: hypothetical protein M0Q91_12475 [Methanoregula sp.]|jgi:hypothetical protein|nr:hypothetical protein [Methanoregula sp.]